MAMRSPSPARLVLRRLSLSMKISAQRKAGRRKRASASLVSPSHGPLRFVTIHWCFAFASMWNTRRLRRKKISAHHLVLDRRDKNQYIYVVAEFHSCFKFYFLLLQNHTIPPPPLLSRLVRGERYILKLQWRKQTQEITKNREEIKKV